MNPFVGGTLLTIVTRAMDVVILVTGSVIFARRIATADFAIIATAAPAFSPARRQLKDSQVGFDDA